MATTSVEPINLRVLDGYILAFTADPSTPKAFVRATEEYSGKIIINQTVEIDPYTPPAAGATEAEFRVELEPLLKKGCKLSRKILYKFEAALSDKAGARMG